MPILPPLIVDPDVDFLNALRSEKTSWQVVPMTSSTGREAQLLISDANTSYCGIFINPKVTQPSGISVIRCARLNKPTTPVYVLNDNLPSIDEKELKQLGIAKSIQKPIKFDQIMGLIA